MGHMACLGSLLSTDVQPSKLYCINILYAALMGSFQNFLAVLLFNYALHSSEAATEIVCDVDGTFGSESCSRGAFLFLQSEF